MKKSVNLTRFNNIFFLYGILFFSVLFFVLSTLAIFIIIYRGLIQVVIFPHTNLPIKSILYSLWGSIYLCGIASLLSLPLGVLLSIFVTEKKHTLSAKCISIFVRVLQGSSSMVIGLLVYFCFVLPFGTFSTLSGAIALSILMLPIIFTCIQNKMEDPFIQNLKENALAMGASYYPVFIQILLPSIFPVLLSVTLLATARALGETSALLFTAFGNSSIQLNPLKPTHSLTLLISEFCTSPYSEYSQAAWISSLLLIFIVSFLHIVIFFLPQKIRGLK